VLGPVLAAVASVSNPYRGRIGMEGGSRRALDRIGRFRRRAS
jgi:hypothetical protein